MIAPLNSVQRYIIHTWCACAIRWQITVAIFRLILIGELVRLGLHSFFETRNRIAHDAVGYMKIWLYLRRRSIVDTRRRYEMKKVHAFTQIISISSVGIPSNDKMLSSSVLQEIWYKLAHGSPLIPQFHSCVLLYSSNQFGGRTTKTRSAVTSNF